MGVSLLSFEHVEELRSSPYVASGGSAPEPPRVIAFVSGMAATLGGQT